MAKNSPGYRCTECGWTTAKWVGRCGECQAWGTVLEEGQKTGVLAKVAPVKLTSEQHAKPITEVAFSSEATHQSTGVAEFDRVLGGGVTGFGGKVFRNRAFGVQRTADTLTGVDARRDVLDQRGALELGEARPPRPRFPGRMRRSRRSACSCSRRPAGTRGSRSASSRPT